ncbi:hypothetical protein C0992_000778, partial [Termitomyces sp. T32_za158]
MQARELRRSKRLKENVEARDLEAQGLAEAQAADDEPIGDVSSTDDDITLGQALNSVVPGSVVVDAGDAQLRRRIQQGYAKDAFFGEILNKPTEHSRFSIDHQLIYLMNTAGVKVLCVPRDRSLITTILEQAHTTVGHFGYQKTLEYARRSYWWPQMAKETKQF